MWSGPATEQREQECERAVGHLLHAVVRDVAHPDVALGGGAQIHVVVTHAARRHDPESRQPVELLGADREVRARQQAADVLPLPRCVRRLDLGVTVEDRPNVVQRVGGIGDEDSHAGENNGGPDERGA